MTAHISTDIAAAPLLWVAPLALFLLTFVLTFRDQTVTDRPFMRRLQVWGTALAVLNLTITWPLALGLTVHLGLFFLNALACHGALYRLRPPASRLTEFYLCLSVGGVLGGIFCGLVAPQLFSTVLEYPILLVAALFCQPGFLGGNGAAWRRDAGRASLACAVALLGAGVLTVTVLPADQVWWLMTVALVVMMMLLWRTPRFVAPLAVAGVLAAAVLWAGGPDRESVRSFFGVHKVARTSDGRFRTLSHGTTLHGAIRLLNEDGTPATGRPEPTTYFSFDGTIGSAIASVRQGHGGALASVSVIGLGSGSLACHAKPGEAWTFLEIDAEVLRIAMNPRYFRFLKECAPDAAVVIGDARLTLADRPAGMSLLVVDAFSSDAIPSHLIAREALALYASKLEPNGAIVVHISNRHLDLARILARTAAEGGFVAYLHADTADEPLAKNFRAASRAVALARDPSHLGPLATTGAWRRLEPEMTRRPWTDDYSNIIQAILDKNRF